MRTEPEEGKSRSGVGATVGLVVLLILLGGAGVIWILWRIETNQANRMLTESSLNMLRSGIQEYRRRHGRDPDSLWLVEAPPSDFFDMWGRPIRYEMRDGQAVRVWSTGPDEDSPKDDLVLPIR